MRLMQEERQWDADRDLDWSTLDATRPLLPGCGALARELGLSSAEELALSQLLGLMAVQAISEHEKVLGAVREDCWRTSLGRLGLTAASELVALGEQFFAEEAKHSQAFARYVSAFAASVGVEPDVLAKVLPRYDEAAWSTRLFRLNARLGGRAMWWLVMITEEESLALFRELRDSSAAAPSQVDPLFYELNRQHFQEEVRHMSYAPLMVRVLGDGGGSPWTRLVRRCDYVLAEALHVAWLLAQMTKLRRLRRLVGDDAAPFLKTLLGAVEKLDALPLTRRLDLLLSRIPFASDATNPQRHRSLRVEVRRNAQLVPGLVQRLLGWARAHLAATTQELP
jgi:hypothetical protein